MIASTTTSVSTVHMHNFLSPFCTASLACSGSQVSASSCEQRGRFVTSASYVLSSYSFSICCIDIFSLISCDTHNLLWQKVKQFFLTDLKKISPVFRDTSCRSYSPSDSFAPFLPWSHLLNYLKCTHPIWNPVSGLLIVVEKHKAKTLYQQWNIFTVPSVLQQHRQAI